jgi:putative addiction module CopG family antidote
MQVILPPELEKLVQRQIANGKYQTVIEVLAAGVQLLEHQEQQLTDADEIYGEFDEDLQFAPLTEAEMVQKSLAVLSNYRNDGVPHDQVEAWVNRLGTDDETPCP